MSRLTARDISRLGGVMEPLVTIVAAASEHVRFMVVEGVRTPERQQELVREGKSRTHKSRHLTGHAVDLAPINADGSIPWNDRSRFAEVADAMKAAARQEGIELVWGGDWANFYDGPHFELPRAMFP